MGGLNTWVHGMMGHENRALLVAVLVCTHTNPMQPASHAVLTRLDSAQTRHTTNIATNSAPYTRLITTSALALQSPAVLVMQ